MPMEPPRKEKRKEKQRIANIHRQLKVKLNRRSKREGLLSKQEGLLMSMQVD